MPKVFEIQQVSAPFYYFLINYSACSLALILGILATNTMAPFKLLHLSILLRTG